eukprot:1285738-Amphidinium_carterae.1
MLSKVFWIEFDDLLVPICGKVDLLRGSYLGFIACGDKAKVACPVSLEEPEGHSEPLSNPQTFALWVSSLPLPISTPCFLVRKPCWARMQGDA